MLDTIPATRAKNRFGELIKRVYTSGESVVVAKDGLPVVIICPMGDWDALSKARERAAQGSLTNLSERSAVPQGMRRDPAKSRKALPEV